MSGQLTIPAADTRLHAVDAPGGTPALLSGRRFKRDLQPRTKTNPLKRDTDNGGVPDGREDKNHNGRLDKGETNPTKPGSG